MINSTSCSPDPYRRFPQEFPLHNRARERFVFPEALLIQNSTRQNSTSDNRWIADSVSGCYRREERERGRASKAAFRRQFPGQSDARAAQTVTMPKFRLPTTGGLRDPNPCWGRRHPRGRPLLPPRPPGICICTRKSMLAKSTSAARNVTVEPNTRGTMEYVTWIYGSPFSQWYFSIILCRWFHTVDAYFN